MRHRIGGFAEHDGRVNDLFQRFWNRIVEEAAIRALTSQYCRDPNAQFSSYTVLREWPARVVYTPSFAERSGACSARRAVPPPARIIRCREPEVSINHNPCRAARHHHFGHTH
jgi:hypothetical protein